MRLSVPITLENALAWLALDPEDLLKSCRQSPFQGPGPGGQKRNRVYSGVRLTHGESGLTAESSASREARRNLKDALRKLRLSIALTANSNQAIALTANSNQTIALAVSSNQTMPQPAAEPSARLVSPPLVFRPATRPTHVDFPAFALTALFALGAHAGRLREAANMLGCTPSALTRFLREDKAVWTNALAIRERGGLHPLKG